MSECVSGPTPVLIVEDDHGIATALRDLLESEGFQVRLAGNGLEALDALGEPVLPAVILLDLTMPGMSGGEFLRIRGEYPRLAPIPLIVITASPSLAPPGTPLLRKPLDADELVARLRGAIASHRSGVEAAG